jgi:hypothetical protein
MRHNSFGVNAIKNLSLATTWEGRATAFINSPVLNTDRSPNLR